VDSTGEMSADAQFEVLVQGMEIYRRVYGNTLIPKNFTAPNDDVWGSLVGTPLGKLADSARNRFRHGRMEERQIQRLRSVDFAWVFNEYKWERQIMPALRTYLEIHGDLLVPRNFQVPENDNQWPRPCWGRSLGKTVNNIRSRKNELNAETKNKLDSIGFVWGVNDGWENNAERQSHPPPPPPPTHGLPHPHNSNNENERRNHRQDVRAINALNQLKRHGHTTTHPSMMAQDTRGSPYVNSSSLLSQSTHPPPITMNYMDWGMQMRPPPPHETMFNNYMPQPVMQPPRQPYHHNQAQLSPTDHRHLPDPRQQMLWPQTNQFIPPQFGHPSRLHPAIQSESFDKVILPALRTYKNVYGVVTNMPVDFVVPREAPWPQNAWGQHLGKVLCDVLNGFYVDFVTNSAYGNELADLGVAIWTTTNTGSTMQSQLGHPPPLDYDPSFFHGTGPPAVVDSDSLQVNVNVRKRHLENEPVRGLSRKYCRPKMEDLELANLDHLVMKQPSQTYYI